jgi:hypothetical protein
LNKSSLLETLKGAVVVMPSSGVGANATTQSKNLCIFPGAREEHAKHLVANLIRKMRAPTSVRLKV